MIHKSFNKLLFNSNRRLNLHNLRSISLKCHKVFYKQNKVVRKLSLIEMNSQNLSFSLTILSIPTIYKIRASKKKPYQTKLFEIFIKVISNSALIEY